MRKVIYFIQVIVLLFLLPNCQHGKKIGSTGRKPVSSAEKQYPIAILPAPINSPVKTFPYAKVPAYNNQQSKQNRFKENGAAMEPLDGGKRERLWFTTSRPDSHYGEVKLTSLYQQIYYVERTVNEGVCMDSGWGEARKFVVKSDDPSSQFIDSLFNHATKGCPTIAGNTMIIACDFIENKGDLSYLSEYKDLYQLTRTGDTWGSPKLLDSLSPRWTWESQPALSPDGKHLFFVSDRVINNKGESYSSEQGKKFHIFYSFNNGTEWRTPVVVKELINADDVENITPSVGPDGDVLYFSSVKDGKYRIFEVPLQLNKNGGFAFPAGKPVEFDDPMVYDCGNNFQLISINRNFNATYPVVYRNKLNKRTPKALLWASNDPEGFGQNDYNKIAAYDLYACELPLKIDYHVVLKEKSDIPKPGNIIQPVIQISGDAKSLLKSDKAELTLLSGFKYQVRGGSYANKENTYICDYDSSYIFIGYCKYEPGIPVTNRKAYNVIIQGPEVNSICTNRTGDITFSEIVQDTVVFDTIFITKGWKRKDPCPIIPEDIKPKYDSIPYFQTGFWEVNTAENLKRDMEKLHDGFEVLVTKDIYNPTAAGFNRLRSDYKILGQATEYEVKTDDKRTYSIANADWIELHPQNAYWGIQKSDEMNPGLNRSIIEGRKARIAQYLDFAKKVDENLDVLTTEIKNKYIDFLAIHTNDKPKLVIEIFAVSDQRDAYDAWYIGDPVAYRQGRFDEVLKKIVDEEDVKIIPPTIDEIKKNITELKACYINMNNGDNGSRLGISSDKVESNTNLSKLRAWFGYKEVYKKLIKNAYFQKAIATGRVALPDNNVEYNKNAEIEIVTRGKRIDVVEPKRPYPTANNNKSNGYYDFDVVRRVDIRVRLIIPTDKSKTRSWCCDPFPDKFLDR
jgi:hypothetical protein